MDDGRDWEDGDDVPRIRVEGHRGRSASVVVGIGPTSIQLLLLLFLLHHSLSISTLLSSHLPSHRDFHLSIRPKLSSSPRRSYLSLPPSHAFLLFPLQSILLSSRSILTLASSPVSSINGNSIHQRFVLIVDVLAWKWKLVQRAGGRRRAAESVAFGRQESSLRRVGRSAFPIGTSITSSRSSFVVSFISDSGRTQSNARRTSISSLSKKRAVPIFPLLLQRLDINSQASSIHPLTYFRTSFFLLYHFLRVQRLYISHQPPPFPSLPSSLPTFKLLFSLPSPNRLQYLHRNLQSRPSSSPRLLPITHLNHNLHSPHSSSRRSRTPHPLTFQILQTGTLPLPLPSNHHPGGRLEAAHDDVDSRRTSNLYQSVRGGRGSPEAKSEGWSYWRRSRLGRRGG